MNNTDIFFALINHEEQYSLWPSKLNIPIGWEKVFEGSKDECLSYVNNNWVDMRPKSFRESLV
ncbi:MbtH family protein [Xenorhabdus sp. SGI246]|uniref:MbtH family protein n=1 Tax=Xenorhabdus sp. SGI246 TaxID=3158263 RepID=UPI00349FD10F